jgi:hypothetical protein
MKIPLDTPFKYEDYELNEIDLDLNGKMNSLMYVRCEGIFRKTISIEEFPAMAAPYFDIRFRLIVAEKVTGIPQAVLTNLPFEPFSIMNDAIIYFFGNKREPSTELPPELEEM